MFADTYGKVEAEEYRAGRFEVRTCPRCNRQINVVLGRWTAHTDPKTWPKGVELRQCANAGRSARL